MRESWGSRFGFIMATAGFAVGIGNIWRFPYMVGQNGGGAFLLVYLLFAAAIGIPLLTAEISLGRRAQLTPIAGMYRVTGTRGSPWNLIGWLGISAAVVLSSYSMMLITWIAGYLGKIALGHPMGGTAEGTRAAYETFVSRPALPIAVAIPTITIMAVLVSRGLHRGVEQVARIVMPFAVVLLAVLAVRSLTFPGAGAGVTWYLTPDFSALDASAVLAALGQAFYSIGIGMAVAFGFGSYLSGRESDVPGSAAWVVLFDTAVAVAAGLVLFPSLFAFGMPPDSGPGLLFITMTALVDQMPAGRMFGTGFFSLLLLAAFTSHIALFEVLAGSLRDSFGFTRARAAWTIAAATLLLCVPVILSQGPWRSVRLLGRDLFGLADALTVLLITIGGFVLALYVSAAWGWERFRRDTNVGAGHIRVTALWNPFVRFLIPVAVGLVLLAGLGVV